MKVQFNLVWLVLFISCSRIFCLLQAMKIFSYIFFWKLDCFSFYIFIYDPSRCSVYDVKESQSLLFYMDI